MVWFQATKIANAIRREDHAGLEELLKKGANPNATEDMRRCPLELAVHMGNLSAVKLLIAYDAAPDMNWHDGTLLHVAADNGRVDIAKELIAKWPTMLHGEDPHFNTPLHAAAARGYAVMVTFLLDQGLNPHAKNRENRTPLFLADKAKHQDVIEILTAYLASIETPQLPMPQKVAAVHKGAAPDEWQQLGEDTVAHIKTEAALGYKITEIFNFTARERTTLFQNLATRSETAVIKNFDEISEKAPLEEALSQLQKRGGRGSISGIRKP